MSDSSIARGAAGKKQVFNSKCVLITLSIALTLSIITICILFSQIGTLKDNYSSLNKKLDTNIYLNPSEVSKSYDQRFTLTPQALDSDTKWEDFLLPQTASSFMWYSPAGGYGTCKFDISASLICSQCQIAVKGAINKADLSPVYSFTGQTQTLSLNFILSEGWNNLGASLALIGDPSSGIYGFSATNTISCHVFGAQTK